MSDIKVSVIIPIYNVEKFLEDCLKSAVNQTLKEIEIVCVNDGTPDDSMEIVDRYAKDDQRIVIVNKENGGLSSARNAGLAVAKGEYVYFLDSDDYIREDAMEILYTHSKTDNLDNIYFDAQTIYDNDRIREEKSNYETYYERTQDYSQVVSGMELLKKMNEYKEFRPSACLQFLRREFLIDNKIKFFEGIIHEDNLFSLECVVEEQRVKHIPDKLYIRRMRDDSIMVATNIPRSSYGYYKSAMEFLKRLENKQFTLQEKEDICARLRAIQTNTFVQTLELEEEKLDEFINGMSTFDHVAYTLFAKRVAEERRRSNQRKAAIDRRDRKIKSLKARIKELEGEKSAIKKSSEYKLGSRVYAIPKLISEFVYYTGKDGIGQSLRLVKRRFNKKAIHVSVIIPVYNAEEFLRPCLDSLIKQTLKKIEIICVNDGSTDGSLDILKEYADKYKRVKLIDKENSGAGDCRNIGLKSARGEYVLFLDADDRFNKTLCEKAYYKARKAKADICFYGANRLDMSKNITEPMGWVLRTNLLPKKTVFRREDIDEKFFQITSGCPWSKMFRRQFVVKNNLQFQNLKNANDLYFVRSAMALADNMTYLKTPLVTYRFATGASTQAGKHKAPLEFYKAYKGLKEKLVEAKVYEKVKQSFINIAFDDCIFNYRTTQTEEAKQQILDTLLNEGFEYFEFDKYEEEYFWNNDAYKEYINILNMKNNGIN